VHAVEPVANACAGVNYMILKRLKSRPAASRRKTAGWRRRTAAAVLLLTCGVFGGYWYLTGQARLIRSAEHYLQVLSGGEVQIAGARFSFFEGIHLTGFTLTVPEGAKFGPESCQGKVVFHADDLYLMHDPVSLLLGRFEVRRIVATRPQFYIVVDRSTGRSNWQVMLAARPATRRGRMQWPLVRLRRCAVRLGSLANDRLRWARPVEIELLAEPIPGEPGVYACAVRPLGQDVVVRHIRVDLRRGQVVGEIPEIRISQLRPSLPAEYDRWCQILELSGQIGAENIEYNPRQAGRYVINLNRVSLSVPLDESEFYGERARQRRLIRLRDVTGQIVFEPTQATFDLAGTLNGAPCRVWGRAERYLGRLAEVGLQVNVEAQDLPLPDRSDPYKKQQIRRLGRKVARFFELFDPRGKVSIRGSIVKPVGIGKPVSFRGVISTSDASACYRGFPYRGEHVRGSVRFADDGIWLDLFGTRGNAAVRITGWLAEATRQTDADITIEAVRVPLDAHLYAALPERFRAILDHFDLFGFIAGKVRIWRKGGSVSRGAAPWHWQANLEAWDLAGRWRGFDYTAWGMWGLVEAADGIIKKVDLRCRDGEASLRITGTADIASRPARVDVRIDIRNADFSRNVVQSLPAPYRKLLGQFGISGRFDGTVRVISSGMAGGGLRWSGRFQWRDGSLRFEKMPYRFDRVQADLSLEPGKIRIESLTGVNGPARLRLSGQALLDDSLAGQFSVAVDGLRLDDQLRTALPARYRAWWQAFRPKGKISLKSDIDLRVWGDDLKARHRTTVVLRDDEACWQDFPVLLEGLEGRIVTDGRFVRIEKVKGRCLGGRFELSGQVTTEQEGLDGEMSLRASGIRLDEQLRLAVPWQVRRLWNDVQPSGRIDLDLDRITFRREGDGRQEWSIAGRVTTDLARIDLGTMLKNVKACIEGQVRYKNPEGRLTGAGKILEGTCEVFGVGLRGLSGVWSRDASGEWRVEALCGELLGGVLDGFVEVSPTAQGSRYGVVFTLDRVDVRRLAASLSVEPTENLSGSLKGQLRLSGLSGWPASRRGGVRAMIVGSGLYRLPILLQVAELLNLPDLGGNARLQRASVEMSIRGRRVVVDRLALRDSVMSMVGQGDIDLQHKRLNLVMVAAKPRSWPSVPLFGEMLQGTVRELVEIRVSGPLGDLAFEARPLRSMQAALKLLFTGVP